MISIRNKILKRSGIYFTTIAIISFTILLTYNYYESKKITLDNIEDSTRMLVYSTLSQINEILISAQKIPE